MLEGILEKILAKILGEYIENLDTLNLHVGVWSGNIELKDIRIKKELLAKLNIPFTIKQAIIKLIRVKFPWRSLSSSPVEIEIEGIDIILVLINQKYWSFLESISPEFKSSIVENFFNENLKFLETFNEDKGKQNEKDETNNKGYFGKLIIRILDNLQISIKNFSFKIEDSTNSSSPFSFGINFKELQIYTTNEQWDKNFIDRTNLENSYKSIHKLLILNGISFYWINDDRDFLQQPLNSNYIIKPMTLIGKLVKNPENGTSCINHLSFNVEEIKFKINKGQLDNITSLVLILNKYREFQKYYNSTQRYKILRPEFPVLILSKVYNIYNTKGKGNYKNWNSVLWWRYAIHCVVLSSRIRNSSQKTLIDIAYESLSFFFEKQYYKLFGKSIRKEKMNLAEKIRYNYILTITEAEELKKWTMNYLKSEQKAKLNKTTESKGFFKFLWGNNETEREEIQEQLTNIYKVLDSNYKNFELPNPNDVSKEFLSNFIHSQIQFTIQRGEIKLVRKYKLNDMNAKEGFLCIYSLFQINIALRKKGSDMEFILRDIRLISIDPLKVKEKINEEFVFGIKQNKNDPMVNLKLSIDPPNNENSIVLKVQTVPLRIFYLPTYLLRIINFVGNKGNVELKNQALQTVRSVDLLKTEQKLEKALNSVKFHLNIEIGNPVIFLGIQEKTLQISFGDLSILNEPDETIMNSVYERIRIGISNISIELLESPIETMLLSFKSYSKFAILKDYSIAVSIYTNISNQEDNPKMIIKINFPQSNIYVTNYIYKLMLQIKNYILPSEIDNTLEGILLSKKDITELSSIIGIISLNGSKKIFGILSQGYIYFYESNSQQYPFKTYSLSNAEIISKEENNLVINNFKEIIRIQFSSQNEMKKWINAILIEINRIKEKLKEKSRVINQSDEPKIEKSNRNIQIMIDSPMLHLYFLNNDLTKWITFSFESFQSNILISNHKIGINIVLGNFNFKTTVDHQSSEIDIVSKEENNESLFKLALSIDENQLTQNKVSKQIIKINISLGNIISYFPPKEIKRLVCSLSNSEDNNSKQDHAKEDELNFESCSSNTMKDMEIEVNIKNIKMIWLHPEKYSQFAKLEIETVLLNISQYCDHMIIKVILGNAHLCDLTNYPNTLILQEFNSNLLLDSHEILGLKGSNEGNILEIIFSTHKKNCPIASDKYFSRFHLVIGSAKMYIIQEWIANRFIPYLLDQFLYSFDPIQKSFPSPVLNKHGNETLYKINMPSLPILIEIKIENPEVYLKPRLNSAIYFIINLGHISIVSQRKLKLGRWIHHPIEELLCDEFMIEAKNISISHFDGSELLSNLNLKVLIEMVCIEAEDYSNHNPKVIDMGDKINVAINDIELKLKQHHYTDILKCIDLNIAYQDKLQDQFMFTLKKPVKKDPLVSNKINISIEKIQLHFLDDEGNIFNSTSSGLISILIAQYIYGASLLTINCNNICSKNSMNEDIICLISSSPKMGESLIQNKIFVKMETKEHKQKDISISVEGYILNLYIDSFLQISNFVIDGMPNYENEKDQPNEYNTDILLIPNTCIQISVRNCLYILPSRFKESNIAMEGQVDMTIISEKLGDIINELKQGEKISNNANDINELTVKNTIIQVNQFSVFSFKNNDLNAIGIELMGKRRIVEPISLYIGIKKYLCYMKEIFYKQTFQLNLDKLNITISYQNMILFAESCLYVLELLEKNVFETMINPEKRKKNYMIVSSLLEPVNESEKEEDKSPFQNNNSPHGDIINIFSKLKNNINNITIASNYISILKQKAKKYVDSSFYSNDELFDSKRNSEIGSKNSFINSPRKFAREGVSIQINKESKSKFDLLINESEIQINGLVIIMLNDKNNAFIPTINLVSKSLSLFLKSEKQISKLQILASISINYFNNLASLWEPFIETTLINFIKLDKSQNTEFKVQINELPLNINLSQSFIKCLYNNYNDWLGENQDQPKFPNYEEPHQYLIKSISSEKQCDFQKINLKSKIEGSTLLMIKNQSGYKLIIKYISKKDLINFTVGINEQLKVCMDYEDLMDSTMQQFSSSLLRGENRFRLKIGFEENFNFVPIEELNIYSVGQYIHYLNSGSFLIYECFIESNLKTVRFRTPICFINKTPLTLSLVSMTNFGKLEEAILNTNDFFSWPIYKEEFDLIFIEKRTNYKSESHSLKLYLRVLKSSKVCEIKIKDKWIVLKLTSDPLSNIYDIEIIPPFIITNSLPLKLFLKFNQASDEFYIDPSFSNYFYLPTDSEFNSLLQIEFLEPAKFNFSLISKENEGKITMTDKSKNVIKLFYRIKSLDRAYKEIIFYTKGVIINKSNLGLSFAYELALSSQRVAGLHYNSQLLLIHSNKKLRIYKNNEYKIANIRHPGVYEDIIIIDNKSEFHLSCLTSFVLANKRDNIYSCVVTINSKYIIVNKLRYSLNFIQSDCYHNPRTINPESFCAFHRENVDLPFVLSLRPLMPSQYVLEKKIDWDWTNAIEIKQSRSMSVSCSNMLNRNMYMILRIYTKIKDNLVYIIVSCENIEKPFFKIENKSSKFSLELSQEKTINDQTYLNPQSSIPYAFPYDQRPKLLNIKFYFGNLHERPLLIPQNNVTKSFEILGEKNLIKIPTTFNKGHYLFLSTYSNGYSRIIQISDVLQEHENINNDKDKEKTYMAFNIEINEIGVSFIHEKNENRKLEIAYLSLKKIEYNQLKIQNENKIRMKIKLIQIDNEIRAVTSNPVICIQLELLNELKKKKDSKVNCFEMVLSKKSDELGNEYIDSINFLIQSLNFYLDTEIIYLFCEFIVSSLNIINSNLVNTHPIFFNSNKFINDNVTDSIDQLDKKKLYIKQLKLSPLEITLTYNVRFGQESNEAQTQYFGKLFGFVQQNIENACIRLNAMVLQHVYGTESEIMHKILDFYKTSLLFTSFNIILSANIIGNPMLVLNTLGTGLSDFFIKPIECLVENPLNISEGIIGGTASLFKNTIEGVFGAASRVTSSLSGNILLLTPDENFVRDREDQKFNNVPSNIFEGVGQGFIGAVKSISSGIIGIVKDPVEGAINEGFIGFSKGILSGVSGVVVKPISGGLDFLAKSTEGIKNTASIFSKKFDNKRVRDPRAFYTKNFIVKEYNSDDSYIYSLFKTISDGKFKNEELYSILFLINKSYSNCFILTENYIVLIDVKEEKDIFSIQRNKISACAKTTSGAALITKENYPIRFHITDAQHVELILQFIKDGIKFN